MKTVIIILIIVIIIITVAVLIGNDSKEKATEQSLQQYSLQNFSVGETYVFKAGQLKFRDGGIEDVPTCFYS